MQAPRDFKERVSCLVTYLLCENWTVSDGQRVIEGMGFRGMPGRRLPRNVLLNLGIRNGLSCISHSGSRQM